MPRKEVTIAVNHGLNERGSDDPGRLMMQQKRNVAVSAGSEGSAPPRERMGHKKAARARLIAGSKLFAAQSAALGPVPDHFEENKMYRVQLTRTVLDHAGNSLRPADDVVIKGSLAEELADAISGATEV